MKRKNTRTNLNVKRQISENIAKDYNLNQICASKIYSYLITENTVKDIEASINYLTTLLTSMGKNEHEINELVSTTLKYGKVTTPKKLNDSIKMCIYYGKEIEEILNTCDIVNGKLDDETIYSLVEATKGENIDDSLKAIESLNSKLDEDARNNLKRAYPLTPKVKFIVYVKFENYIKSLNNSTNKNVLCK